jgi:polysaccharide export outer membrane protein
MRIVLFLFAAVGLSQTPSQPTSPYVLGREDQISIHVLDLQEIGEGPFRIDTSGYVNVPRAGRIKAAGLTAEQLETAISERLKQEIRNPVVTISVVEYRSQPVSVLGSVNNPGIQQIRGGTTLYEVISAAGGLRADAGDVIKVTRHKEAGVIRLPGATADASGGFYVAEVSVNSMLEGKNPQENIPIKPNDVISVPKAELIYVVGAVKRAGGFVLGQRQQMSVLEALAMAEGLDRVAAPRNAKILRAKDQSIDRTEIPVNVTQILTGKSRDVSLRANDVLFIPDSKAKNAAIRTIEAAISVGTGLAIYRH